MKKILALLITGLPDHSFSAAVTLNLVPTKISCPLFWGQVFAGLRLTVPTAYISVVSGN